MCDDGLPNKISIYQTLLYYLYDEQINPLQFIILRVNHNNNIIIIIDGYYDSVGYGRVFLPVVPTARSAWEGGGV